MPPPYVKTIREEILYEYAKLISRSAYGTLQRGFITERFNKLRDGEITISGTIREWEREQELPKQCVYCGSIRDLTTDHLIPRSREGTNLQIILFSRVNHAMHREERKGSLSGLASRRKTSFTGW
jgi:5-methylcytosine-specific restriction endonuclease McrA